MKSLIIVFFLFAITSSYSADFKLSDYSLGVSHTVSADRLGNEIAVLCSTNYIEGGYSYSGFRIYENGKWDSIPSFLKLNNSYKDILHLPQSQIHFDSTEAIWVGSDMMYRYKNGKWDAFFIDDSLKQYRRYEQFCVDIYNNLWITTSINDTSMKKEQDYRGNSEILKFDGQSFKTIVKTNFMYSFKGLSMYGARQSALFALSNGRVVLHRIWNPTDDDFDLNDSNSNLIFYSQDGSFTNMQIPCLSGEKYKEYIKDVSYIYPENLNKIWIALNITSWWNPFTGDEGSCCSGLVVYQDGEWIVFDESNNIPVRRDTSLVMADPIYRILKLDKSNYLVFGGRLRTIYTMGNDYILHKANLKEIGDNSLIIRPSSNSTLENYKINFRFDDTNSVFHTPLPNISDVFIANDSVWVIAGFGIIVFPKNIVVLDIEGTPSHENNSQIYPNPASDFFNVNNPEEYTDYIIYNNLGEKIIKGNIDGNPSRIDIRDLSDGLYFIRLMKNKKHRIIAFIKN